LGTVDCNSCRGKGKIKGDGHPIDCTTCGGSGKVPSFTGSGMNKMVIPMGIGEFGKTEKLPTAFGGFIERSESGAKIFSEAFHSNMSLALRPFGLEHLLEVPYNQSGTSKTHDMQEGYAFIMSMSDHVGSLLRMTLTAIASIRYKSLPEGRKQGVIPEVVMPKSFNLSSTESIFTKMKEAETYKLPDHIKLSYAKRLIEREYGETSDEAVMVRIKQEIDPMPAASWEQKKEAEQFLGRRRFVLTMNIDSILKNCVREDASFLRKSITEQEALIYAKVDEIISEL
jgi:hypothetical protein